jgi:hypothetical protein
MVEAPRPVAPFQVREERNFNGVGENSSATLQLDTSRTIHSIFIPFKGIALANILSVLLKVEGTTAHEFGTGAELNLRNKYLGKQDAVVSNILEIDFSSAGSIGGPLGANLNLASLIGCGIAGPTAQGGIIVSPKNIELEIRLGAKKAGETVTLNAYTTSVPPSELGGMQMMKRYQESGKGATTIDFDNIPFSTGLINRIYLHHPANAIKRVGMRINSIEVLQNIPTEIMNAILEAEPLGTRVKQSGLTVIDTGVLGISQYGYMTDSSRVTDIRIRADVIPAVADAVTTVTMFLEMWNVIPRGGA